MKNLKLMLFAVLAISANNAFSDITSMFESLKEKISTATPQSLKEEIAKLKVQKDDLVNKTPALSNVLLGGEVVKAALTQQAAKIQEKIDQLELKLAQLEPTPELLDTLKAKFNKITELKNKAQEQLEELAKKPKDVATNIVESVHNAAITGYNAVLATLKPIIDSVQAKLASMSGLNAAAALGAK